MSEPTTMPETPNLPATRPTGPVGTVPMGVMPSSIEDGWRLATLLSKSNLVPEDFRGKPENVLVALQLGAEVGFPPMQALQSIAVINGRPSIWGDGFLALLIRSSKYRAHDEYFEVKGDRRDGLVADDWKHDDTAAVCTFWRTDRETPTTVRFTVGQAKKANLIGKSGTWQTYPDRMLKMRARSWAGRDAFPDVLRGLATAEEAGDIVLDVPPAPREPRRASETKTAAPPPTVTEVERVHAVTGRVPPQPETSQGETQTLTNVLVTHTAFIKPKDGEPYFLITVIQNQTRVPIELITRDEPTYKEAAAREGSDDRLTITFHETPTGKTDKVRVIDALDPCDVQPTLLG